MSTNKDATFLQAQMQAVFIHFRAFWTLREIPINQTDDSCDVHDLIGCMDFLNELVTAIAI
jgi:hypothetical protein